MRVLVASEENTMDSHVARRFEDAGWYLIVNREIVEMFRNQSHHDRHEVLVSAARENVAVVVTGRIGRGTARLMSSLGLRVAYGRNVTVREAVARLEEGSLRLLDPRGDRISRRGSVMRDSNSKACGQCDSVLPSATERGRHHLQQYGGRGH
jgi:predicted Fe-Mo cluster-binding NifX family protein